nr:GAF and ANTAR domain-containing protein [Streptomyces scabichelini]
MLAGCTSVRSERAEVAAMQPRHPHPERPERPDRWRITEALAAAASATDPRQVPQALCRASVDLLPVSGASISLVADSAVRITWCASDETAAGLAEAQYTLGDGPCRSALELAAPVLAEDLTRGRDARRWPVFAHQAVELDVRAVYSLPLGTGALAFGTLDLYRRSAGALSGEELGLALLVRDAITFAVLKLPFGADGSDATDGGGVASWVEAAEADHMEVHQAIGMVMVQLDVDPEQALDRIRARAFAQGRTVSELARDVVAGTVCFPEAAPGTDEERDDGQGGHGGDEVDGGRS